MITISLFYYYEKVFILTNMWMIGKKINEARLPEKEDFHSHLSIEDITGAYYALAARVCKDFEVKNLGEYHDLYVQSDTLLLADVFENFRNMFINIYKLDPAKFKKD